MSILRSLEYKASFFIGLLGLIMVNGVSLLLIWVILENFYDLGGWSFWEVVFNYAMFLTCLGLHKVFFRNLSRLQEYIIDGTFDRYMIRPWSPFLQVIGERLSITDISDFLIGIVCLSLAYYNLILSWSAIEFLLLIACIINGVVIFTVILLSINSLAFWLIRATPFLYGTSEIQESVQHYPVEIFGNTFRLFVTFILPYSLINYYPSLILLDKVSSNKLLYIIALMLFVTIMFIVISCKL